MHKAAVVIALILLPSCGSATEGAPETPPVSSSAPSEAASVPVEVDADSLGAASITVDAPDLLTAGFGAIWVQQVAGSVSRIDSSTSELTKVELAPGACHGISAGLGYIWACEADHVVRIDPDSLEVKQVDVQRGRDTGRFPATTDRVWVLSGAGDIITGISEDGEVADVIELPYACTDLSTSAEMDLFWVACADRGAILEVDASSGEVRDLSTDAAGAIFLVASADSVWVMADGGIVRISRDTGEVLARVAVPKSSSGAITFADGDLWVHHVAPFLQRIDPASDSVVREFASSAQSPGDVLIVDGTVWVSLYAVDEVRSFSLAQMSAS